MKWGSAILGSAGLYAEAQARNNSRLTASGRGGRSRRLAPAEDIPAWTVSSAAATVKSASASAASQQSDDKWARILGAIDRKRSTPLDSCARNCRMCAAQRPRVFHRHPAVGSSQAEWVRDAFYVHQRVDGFYPEHKRDISRGQG
jgi:hypothetical protein